MGKRIDSTEALRRWQKNTADSGESYKNGVQSVTESPTEKAAAKKEKYERGVREAVSSGRWERGLQKVTLQQWKEAAANKGARRLADGVKEGAGKMQRHLAEFTPFLQRITDEVNAMPNDTPQQRIERMVRQAQLTAEYRNRT